MCIAFLVYTRRALHCCFNKHKNKMKHFSILLLLALCACNEQQTQRPEKNRIQFKDYNSNHHAALSIVAVDTIEFLVNHRTGHMIRITNQ